MEFFYERTRFSRLRESSRKFDLTILSVISEPLFFENSTSSLSLSSRLCYLYLFIYRRYLNISGARGFSFESSPKSASAHAQTHAHTHVHTRDHLPSPQITSANRFCSESPFLCLFPPPIVSRCTEMEHRHIFFLVALLVLLY